MAAGKILTTVKEVSIFTSMQYIYINIYDIKYITRIRMVRGTVTAPSLHDSNNNERNRINETFTK